MCVTFHQICIHLMQWPPKHRLQTGYIKTRTRGPYKPGIKTQATLKTALGVLLEHLQLFQVSVKMR